MNSGLHPPIFPMLPMDSAMHSVPIEPAQRTDMTEEVTDSMRDTPDSPEVSQRSSKRLRIDRTTRPDSDYYYPAVGKG